MLCTQGLEHIEIPRPTGGYDANSEERGDLNRKTAHAS